MQQGNEVVIRPRMPIIRKMRGYHGRLSWIIQEPAEWRLASTLRV